MPDVMATLQAMEAMAAHAVAADLHSMMQDLQVLRTHLVLEDRTRADSLLLRLDRLISRLTSTTITATPPLALKLRSLDTSARIDVSYVVRLFDATSGAPDTPAIRPSFDAAVHLVRSRLPRDGQYYIAATWSGDSAKLAVSTPRGQILARIEPQRSESAHAESSAVHAARATAQPV